MPGFQTGSTLRSLVRVRRLSLHKMSYPSAPEWAMNIRCLTTGGVLPVRVSESAAPGLPGEGSGTIHLRRGNTTAGLDQGQFRASANSHVARFGSFSAAAGECGLLSQASRMVADLGADSVSYCFPSQPRRKSLCNCINSLADARAAAHRKTGVLRRPMAPPPGSARGRLFSRTGEGIAYCRNAEPL